MNSRIQKRAGANLNAQRKQASISTGFETPAIGEIAASALARASRSDSTRAVSSRSPRQWIVALALIGCIAATSVAGTPIFTITNFASPPSSLTYFSGFTGTDGVTATWPAEMGWQGDRIDIAFNCPASPPPTARHYRFRMIVTQQFTQAFDVAVLAGPSLADLVEVKSEFVDTPRVLVATIPLNRFVPGQVNYVRMQGTGVAVGNGQPAGIQWNRWLLSRTDTVEDLDTFRAGQLLKQTNYILAAIQPNGLVRDGMPYSPGSTPFHPATPDAAGFALLGLCVADQFGVIADAQTPARNILRAYSGNFPGMSPARNTLGHWWHWMDVNTGQPAAGWGDNYTTIGTAILMQGALFAKNHFIDDAVIASYVDQMRASTNFDLMIHPSLNGQVALATNASGGHLGYLSAWNEYMLVVSCGLRDASNARSQAIAWRWLDPQNCPVRFYPLFTTEIPTLTDSGSAYAPAFWVQQAHFFCTDFASNPGFEALFRNHERADALYCAQNLVQPYRYGLTAGVSPAGYTVDRILAHQNVFSPEAVGGFGDIDTLMEFLQDQPPASNPRYRYGLLRSSSAQPTWTPPDGALVDHLFLMFGIAESIDPLFFKRRQAFQVDADVDGIADVYDNCLGAFNPDQLDSDGDGVGDACEACPGDVNGDGDVNLSDLSILLANFGTLGGTTQEMGDLNGDGDVNLSDLSILLGNFGLSC